MRFGNLMGDSLNRPFANPGCRRNASARGQSRIRDVKRYGLCEADCFIKTIPAAIFSPGVTLRVRMNDEAARAVARMVSDRF
ncbi:MAG: hypothetical protein OXD42_00570 [Rhodospirillaceae bacterium]|nr:hypothetical protein [Rhodospirillaceae bacterium]